MVGLCYGRGFRYAPQHLSHLAAKNLIYDQADQRVVTQHYSTGAAASAFIAMNNHLPLLQAPLLQVQITVTAEFSLHAGYVSH